MKPEDIAEICHAICKQTLDDPAGYDAWITGDEQYRDDLQGANLAHAVSDILNQNGIDNQLIRHELHLSHKETGEKSVSWYFPHSIRVEHVEFDVFSAIGEGAVIRDFMSRYEMEDYDAVDKTREVLSGVRGCRDTEHFKSLFEKMRVFFQHCELQKSTQPSAKHTTLRRM